MAATERDANVLRRSQRFIVGSAFVAVVAILAVELTHADREPLNAWLSGASLLLAGVGAGVGIGRARFVWLVAPLAAAIAWLSAGLAAAGSAYDVIFATFAVVPTVAVGLAIGLGSARLLAGRARAGDAIRALAAGAFVMAMVPYPLALLQHQRTIAVAHSAGRLIDDRAATLRGVGLRDSATAVQRVFGTAPPYHDESSAGAISPLIGGDLFDGPSALDFGKPPIDTFMRYTHVAFQVRRGRVRWIQINDHNVATSRGVGPGDSMSLVRRAYPQAYCADDSIHAEPDYIYYPTCQLRLGPTGWLTFFGTYKKPGVPVLAVWLSTQQLEGSR